MDQNKELKPGDVFRGFPPLQSKGDAALDSVLKSARMVARMDKSINLSPEDARFERGMFKGQLIIVRAWLDAEPEALNKAEAEIDYLFGKYLEKSDGQASAEQP